MSIDLKTQLLEAAVALKLPTYCNLSIEDAYTKFCAELDGKKLRDPRNEEVCIYERNFPKFLGMKRADPRTGRPILNQHGKPIKAKASTVLQSLKAGSFDRKQYFIEYARLRTMFWIPDVISSPDSIRSNIHRVIEGDQVYVKKYQKVADVSAKKMPLGLRPRIHPGSPAPSLYPRDSSVLNRTTHKNGWKFDCPSQNHLICGYRLKSQGCVKWLSI
jgi:hypothetical protein